MTPERGNYERPPIQEAVCEIHFKLLPWMRAAFIESNPLPVKAALAK